MTGLALEMFGQPPANAEVRNELDLVPPDDEVRAAAWDLQYRYNNSISEQMLWGQQHEQRLDELEKNYGKLPDYVAFYPAARGGADALREYITNGDVRIGEDFEPIGNSVRGGMVLTSPEKRMALKAIAFMDAMVQSGAAKSDSRLWDELVAEAAEEVPRLQSVINRGDLGDVFIGTGGAAVVDPLVLATIPFGASAGAGRPALQALGRVAGTEAGLAFGSELLIQAKAYQFRNEIGYPMSFNEAAFNVLAATVGSAVFATSIAGGIRLAKHYRQKVRAGEVTPTSETEAAAAQLEAAGQAQETVPPRGDLEVHNERINEARSAAEQGELIPIDAETAIDEGIVDTPGVRAMDERVRTAGADGIALANGADIRILDPDEINVDAKRFQFKTDADADEFGVRSTLREIDEFDENLAGEVLAWESKSGEVFVADGHQRLGIAKRAKAGGQENVFVTARVLREADGVPAGYARELAALRNATSTSGSAIDVAKVIRNSEFMRELPGVGARTAAMLQGRQLANLGDEAFDLAVNEVIPQKYAAIVGERIKGDAEQVAAIDALRRLNPANATQARAMVEDMRAAGFEKMVTEDLFGERELAESLIKERAQVLDEAIKQARADKTTFGRLLAQRENIEQVGQNLVDEAASLSRLTDAQEALAQLSRLSNVKGPVSDALSRAAREVKAGAKPSKAAQSVLRAVEGSDVDPLGVVRPIEHLNGQRTSKLFPDYEAGKGLTPYERAVENDMLDRIEAMDWEDAKNFYYERSLDPKTGDYSRVLDRLREIGLSESEVKRHGRKIVAVDVAREFSPEFVKDQSLANAVHEPSSAFAKRMLNEKLAEPVIEGEDRFLQMAGGTGSGKTTALRQNIKLLTEAHAVLDGNAAKAGSAIKKFEAGIKNGLKPRLMYVYTTPLGTSVEAADGAIVRAVGRSIRKAARYKQDSGRTITVIAHAGTHAGSRNAVPEILAALGKRIDSEDVIVVDNSRGPASMKMVPLDEIPPVDFDSVVKGALDIIEDLYRNGDLAKYPKIAKGFLDFPEGRARIPELFDGATEALGAAGREGGSAGAVSGRGNKAGGAANAELDARGTGGRRSAVQRTSGAEPGGRAADELAEPFEPTPPDDVATFTRLKKAIKATGSNDLDDVEETVRQVYRALEDNDVKIMVNKNGNEIEVSAREFFDQIDADERALLSVENCMRLRGVT